MSEPIDVVEADVPFAAFNLADVAPVKLGAMRQILLAQTNLAAQFSDARAERLALSKLLRSRGGHLSTLGVWCL